MFLPYTPLHHLLLEAVGRPLVLTSGNLTDEPLATDDEDALVRLGGLADGFLAHDREIRARYDDSVTRVVARRESVVRRARGYAPEPLPLPVPTPVPLLAVGAELKHTFTLARGGRAHVAPHNGDLEDLATHRAFTDGLAHLSRLLALEPEVAVHDLHPEYLSTKFALERFPAARRIAVQHHHAHVASCAAEHGITGPFLGVAYDGLGMGDDGTFWGGELFLADLRGYRRLARFGRAPMPGGALAVRKPYRMALGYLLGAEAVGGSPARPSAPASRARRARRAARSSPASTRARSPSSGPRSRARLNAPVASAPRGACSTPPPRCSGSATSRSTRRRRRSSWSWPPATGRGALLPYAPGDRVDGLLVFDPRPTLAALLDGARRRPGAGRPGRGLPGDDRRGHAASCSRMRGSAPECGIVCLSGGVFQNRRLASDLLARLAGDGFEVFINRQVPVNDGGVSYGQAAIAAARLGSDAGAASIEEG